MGQEENKRVVRAFLETILVKGALDAVDEFVSPDCLEHHGVARIPSGVDGMKAHIRSVREMYLDPEIQIDHQVAEGDWVATYLTFTGTHAGSWLGMAPTQKRLTFTGVNLDRVVDGKIVEHGGAANMLGPFLEAGALKPVGPSPKGSG